MKKPFLNALGAAGYIAFLGLGFQLTSQITYFSGTILVPMTMLSLFVLSAAVMGFLFLSEPLQLLVEGKKKEAVACFGKTVGFFACFVALYGVLVFVL